MVFNPLFLQVVNNQETPLLNKTQKLTGPSYLFSDIIKVHLDKNDSGVMTTGNEAAADNNLLSSIVSALSSQDTAVPLAGIQALQLQNSGGITMNPVLQIKTFNQPVLAGQQETDLKGEEETLNAEELNSLLVGNTELYNFINGLLLNHQFDGKISIVKPDAAESNDAAKSLTDSLPLENLSAGEVLKMLKSGSTIAVENSAFQSSNGLLITLVELPGDAAKPQTVNTAVIQAEPENILANSKNIPPAQTLAGMMASQNAPTENARTTEQLYKLKFSLVDNPEVSETAIDTQKPIIKLPFVNAPAENNSAFKIQAETTVLNKNLTAETNAPVNPAPLADESQKLVLGTKDSVPADQKLPGGNPNTLPEMENSLNKIELGKAGLTVENLKQTKDASATDEIISETGKGKNSSSIQSPFIDAMEKEMKAAVTQSESESKAKENEEPLAEANLKAEDSVKEEAAGNIEKNNTAKEPDVKTGKFVNIERVKTDSGIQTKGTQAPEVKDQEIQKQELPAPETLKKDLPVTEGPHTEQKRNQKADDITDKKSVTDSQSKLHDTAVLNGKEKDSNVSSPKEKQDSPLSAENKTDSKGSAKEDMNSSSKDQNHQNTESAPAGDRQETKGKPQEDHSFSIGNQTKPGDGTFTVKRTMDSNPFSEAARTVKAAEVMKEISKFIQQGDKSSITLKIDPENLGTVKIALDLADKVVHANIEVENEAARKLMENNLNQLYNSLSQNGVQLNSINISLANSEHKQGKLPNQKRRAFTGDGDKDQDDIDALRQKQMGYNTYDYLI